VDDATIPTPFTADSENGRYLILRPGESAQEVSQIADTLQTVLFTPESPFAAEPVTGSLYQLGESDEDFATSIVTRRSYLVDGVAVGPSGDRPASFLDGVGVAPSSIYSQLYREIDRIRAAGVRFSIVIEADA
jgi:hypothetical protein